MKAMPVPKHVPKAHFEGVAIDCSNGHGSEVVFDACNFVGCSVGMSVKHTSEVFGIQKAGFRNCSLNSFRVGPVVLQQCWAEGVRCPDVVFFWGTMFSRCKLSGEMPALKLLDKAGFDASPDTNEAFAKARSEHYASIDWALDISEARFRSFECYSIPPRLIRMNGHDQVAVDIKKCRTALDESQLEGEEEALDWLDMFVDDNAGREYGLLVAEQAKRVYLHQVALIKVLVERGLARTEF